MSSRPAALASGRVLAWGSRSFQFALLLLVLLVGLASARLPPATFALLLAGAIFVVATLIEPLVGLALTLIVAPFGALALAAGLRVLPFDTSHLLLGLTLSAWLAHKIAGRSQSATGDGGVRLLPIDFWLLALVGAGLLSLLAALSLQSGLTEVLKWLELGAVMLFVRDRARDPHRRNWAIAAVLAAGLVQAGIGIWEFAFRHTGPAEFLISGSLYRAYGTFEQPNPFGGFMGLLLPVALGLLLALVRPAASSPGLKEQSPAGWLWTAALLLVAVAFAVALVASWSRGAWLGTLAALAALVLFAPRRRIVGAGLLAAILLAGALAWQTQVLPAGIRARLSGFSEYAQVYDVRGVDITNANYAVLERLAHWEVALDMWRDHPWIGVGLGNYAVIYPVYARLNWPFPLGHAHDIYLNFAAETGLIGLVAYLLFWGAVFWLTIRTLGRTQGLERGLVLGILGAWVLLSVHNLVDNLYVNGVYLHIGALLGLLTVTAYERK